MDLITEIMHEFRELQIVNMHKRDRIYYQDFTIKNQIFYKNNLIFNIDIYEDSSDYSIYWEGFSNYISFIRKCEELYWNIFIRMKYSEDELNPSFHSDFCDSMKNLKSIHDDIQDHVKLYSLRERIFEFYQSYQMRDKLLPCLAYIVNASANTKFEEESRYFTLNILDIFMIDFEEYIASSTSSIFIEDVENLSDNIYAIDTIDIPLNQNFILDEVEKSLISRNDKFSDFLSDLINIFNVKSRITFYISLPHSSFTKDYPLTFPSYTNDIILELSQEEVEFVRIETPYFDAWSDTYYKDISRFNNITGNMGFTSCYNLHSELLGLFSIIDNKIKDEAELIATDYFDELTAMISRSLEAFGEL